MSENSLFAVANTLKAGWLELRLAKWLGERLEFVDSGFKVTCSQWRGRIYFIDFTEHVDVRQQ